MVVDIGGGTLGMSSPFSSSFLPATINKFFGMEILVLFCDANVYLLSNHTVRYKDRYMYISMCACVCIHEYLIMSSIQLCTLIDLFVFQWCEIKNLLPPNLIWKKKM